MKHLFGLSFIKKEKKKAASQCVSNQPQELDNGHGNFKKLVKANISSVAIPLGTCGGAGKKYNKHAC